MMLNPLNYLYICFVVSRLTSSPLSLVTVTLKGTAEGGHPISSWVTEQIWKEGEVRREMCFSLFRYKIWVLVTVSREEDWERLARKQRRRGQSYT